MFGGSTETNEDAQEVVRDVQGPSMQAWMENEQQARMRAAADNWGYFLEISQKFSDV